MEISKYLTRSRLILGVSIAISIVSLTALGLMLIGRDPDQSSAPARVIAAINDKTTALKPRSRTIELTSEKATRVRNAIKQGDYATARKIFAAVVVDSRMQNWRYYPFSDFIAGISDVRDPAFEARLNEWVAQNEGDAIPLLVRSQYYLDAGWFERGHKFVKETEPAHLASFADDMQRAFADVSASIRLDDRNPYGFYLQLRILHGFGMSQQMKDVFDEAIAKFPSYYPLYDIVLSTLDPRWGGTVEAMYAFVDQYAGHAADHSPLKLLFLSLYRDLLGSAAAACDAYSHNQEKMARCVASTMGETVRPELEKRVLSALRLYDHSDKHQFNVFIKPILSDMLWTAGGDAYSGAFLELAATSLHSDTRLVEGTGGRNDYMIDKAVSESWYRKGFYDNALKKAQEALRDVAGAPFPDEAEKDLAIAGIYKSLAEIYSALGQYADVIAYEKAAIALGGSNGDGHYVCHGYYRLKILDAAAQACTEMLRDEPNDLLTHYWRGKVYRDLGQADAALQDFTVVADSENRVRADAAIEASMIYFGRNDIRSALNVLNQYTYLYDPDLVSKETLSVSYNNRCYAYMELSDLKRALEDCTASLKYGSLPDAYRKQQELIKRLAAHETGL